jgi:hypothetical protein
MGSWYNVYTNKTSDKHATKLDTPVIFYSLRANAMKLFMAVMYR